MDWYEVLTLTRGDEACLRVWEGRSPVAAMTQALAEMAKPETVSTYIDRNGSLIWANGSLVPQTQEA